MWTICVLNPLIAGIRSAFICPLPLSCTTDAGIALVLTCLSIKSPNLLAKNERIANCVVSRALDAPPTSSSPNPTSVDIAVIEISDRLSFRAVNSLTETLLLNTMLPVLL